MIRRWLRTLALLGMTAGCTDAPAEAPQVPPETATAQACDRVLFEDFLYIVCRAKAADIRIANTDAADEPLLGFDGLSQVVPPGELAFAMNAGMYDTGFRAIGLLVEDGEERQPINRADGPGNFHLMPNGVFWIDEAGAHVAATEDFAMADDIRWATQSGPMLVIDGAMHPAFDEDGESRHVRNGVGVTQDGLVVTAISEVPVSFGRFARFFRDELRTPNALFLDGAVSSIWVPDMDLRVQRRPLGPLLYAVKPVP